MQMQIPQASDIAMPAPVMANTALGKPPRHAEAAPADENKTLHPQISLEAAKVQQLGASLGTKLRPESAQKIQVRIRQQGFAGLSEFSATAKAKPRICSMR